MRRTGENFKRVFSDGSVPRDEIPRIFVRRWVATAAAGGAAKAAGGGVEGRTTINMIFCSYSENFPYPFPRRRSPVSLSLSPPASSLTLFFFFFFLVSRSGNLIWSRLKAREIIIRAKAFRCR